MRRSPAFQNVAAQLEAGGCFVIEVGVPGLQRLPAGETVRAFAVTPEHLGFEAHASGARDDHDAHVISLRVRVAETYGPGGDTRARLYCI